MSDIIASNPDIEVDALSTECSQVIVRTPEALDTVMLRLLRSGYTLADDRDNTVELVPGHRMSCSASLPMEAAIRLNAPTVVMIFTTY